MTGQGNVAVNPLIEKFGPGPLSIFAVIRMPDVATWRRYPEVAGEMAKAAMELARDYRVETGRCGCCGRETSEIIVGESARSLTETGRRWAVCRPCIQTHGGASLRRKLAYIDHTRNGGK
jgi:hypothetical protein